MYIHVGRDYVTGNQSEALGVGDFHARFPTPRQGSLVRLRREEDSYVSPLLTSKLEVDGLARRP